MQHILFLLEHLSIAVSLPLLTRRLLLATPLLEGTLCFNQLAKRTYQDCESAIMLHALLQANVSTDNSRMSLWKGVVDYYFGDAPQSREYFNIVLRNDEDNLLGLFYMLLALQAYLEPMAADATAAKVKALSFIYSREAIPVEQAYYAGQILFMLGDKKDALKFFFE